jgi:hypothetical protein
MPRWRGAGEEEAAAAGDMQQTAAEKHEEEASIASGGSPTSAPVEARGGPSWEVAPCLEADPTPP